MAGFQDIPEGELLLKLFGHKSMQATNFDLEAGTPHGRSIFYKSNIYRSFLDDRAEFFLSRAAKQDDEEKVAGLAPGGGHYRGQGNWSGCRADHKPYGPEHPKVCPIEHIERQ